MEVILRDVAIRDENFEVINWTTNENSPRGEVVDLEKGWVTVRTNKGNIIKGWAGEFVLA